MVSFFEAENLRAVCGGRWLEPPRPPVAVSGVGIDTRGDLRGKVFIAIRGERYDGHAYLPKAVGAGASLVVVEREPPAGRLSGGVGVLLVDDTRRALGRMARAYRTVAETAKRHSLTYRDAAFHIGVERVARTSLIRGFV